MKNVNPVVFVVAVPLLSLLSACGADPQESGGVEAQAPEVASHAVPELAVKVALEPSLAGRLRVVSARAVVPGRNNPKEVLIVLENTGDSQVSARLEGQWLDEGGRGFGGVQSAVEIAGGTRKDISSGTRSSRATLFSAKILPSADEALDPVDAALLDAAARGAQGYGIAFTRNPVLKEIPAWPVRGLANGALFRAGALLFTPNRGGWRLEIHDREFDPMQGTAAASNFPGAQTIYIDLPEQPAPGAVYQRPMSYGGGYFQIRTSPGATDTTSWNTSVAWAIAIDEWEQRPWNEEGGSFQRAGSASGRLYICFQSGQGPIEDSFVAGEFRGVPIMYYGRPK
jgi:hypothetical protein